MHHILYLHGFLSSPASVKAQATREYFAQYYPDVQLHIPQLSNSPTHVEQQLLTLIAQHPGLIENGLKAIGSSMGGYLSTYLIEKYGGKAVLVNPAVRPYELLQNYLGEHVNPYTNEGFTIVPSDIEVLKQLDTARLNNPKAYRVMLQTDDETLDYRQAEQKYAHSHLIVEQGGDHSFVDYSRHLPDIAEFLLNGIK